MLRGTIIDAKDREKSWNIQENCRNEQMFAPLWFAVSRRASVRMKRGEPQSMRYMSAANANCNSRCNLQGTGIDHTKIRCPTSKYFQKHFVKHPRRNPTCRFIFLFFDDFPPMCHYASTLIFHLLHIPINFKIHVAPY